MVDRRIRIIVDAESEGSFEGAARELEDLDRAASGSNDSLGHLTKGHKALDDEIQKTKQAASDLRSEFENTGNLGLLGDARKLDAQVKKLEQYKTSLNNVGTEARNVNRDLENVGREVENISFAGLSVPPQVLVPTAVALAPFIGAALSGGIQLAGAGGILAAGIYGAFQDQRVRSAFGVLGTDLKTELTNASEGLQSPLIRAADTLDTAFHKINLRDIFAGVEPDIDRLSTGAAGFITNIGGGLDRLAHNSQAIVGEFADELPKLGSSISSFFDSLDTGLAAQGSVDGLSVAFTGLNATISGTGAALGDLSTVFEVLGGHLIAEGVKTKAFGDGLKSFIEGLALGPALAPLSPILDRLGLGADKAHTSFNYLNQDLNQVQPAAQKAGLGASLASGDFAKLSAAIANTGDSTDILAGQMSDRLLNSMLGVDQATLGFAQAQLQAGETVKHNVEALHSATKALDIHTAAGQADRGAVLNAVAANIRNYDALIQSGVGASDAAKAYDANTQSLVKQLQQAHLTGGQIDQLIGKYKTVPDTVNTAIELHGVADAIDQLIQVQKQIAHLPYEHTIKINEVTYHVDIGDSPGQVGPIYHGFAKGGLVPEGSILHAAQGLNSGILPPRNPGTLVLAGEPGTKGEIFAPLAGISQQRAMQLGQILGNHYGFSVVPNGYGNQVRLAGGSGGGPVRIQVSADGGGVPPMQGVATMFMYMIRTGLINLTTNQEGRVVVG